MKIKYLLVTILFVKLLMIASCQNSSLQTIKSKEGFTFQQSQQQWEAFKKSSNNSYTYSSSHSSMTGYRSETTINVVKGEVVRRKFKETSQQDGKLQTIFIEESDQIGIHSDGKAPVTIDDLYKQCYMLLDTVDIKHYSVYFETTKDGLLLTCGIVPNNCADDCFIGVSIEQIRPNH